MRHLTDMAEVGLFTSESLAGAAARQVATIRLDVR